LESGKPSAEAQRFIQNMSLPPAPSGKTARLQIPPAPMPLTALMPEELADAWIEGKTTALALHNAASSQFAPPGAMLPWTVLSKTVSATLNSRYLDHSPEALTIMLEEAAAAGSMTEANTERPLAGRSLTETLKGTN
jgi:hypothetical protein